jgi:hypothetical protein
MSWPQELLKSQEHILHSAASILRHDIHSFVINNEDYPNANEVSLAISVAKMPQSLLKLICWLIDEKAYKAASEPYTVPIDKIRKILGVDSFAFQTYFYPFPSRAGYTVASRVWFTRIG